MSVQPQEIHKFLERYFVANDCAIEGNTASHLTVQLTIDMDKELMNRPFYWHYLEKTGGVPNPMKLTLITNQNAAPEDLKGDIIHFGSPRLHQIFESTKSIGSFIRLYEQTNSLPRQQASTPLHPWLNVNLKVSYKCDRKKDILMSLGIHLISGVIVESFHEKLHTLPLTPKIPDMCFTMSPIIKPQSGLSRLEHYVRGFIASQDHSWAEEARARWQKDLNLLNHFYEDLEEEELPETYETEKKALQEQYEPKIIVDIINGGLFYMTPSFMSRFNG